MEIFCNELPKSCRSCSFQCYGSCLGGSDILNGDPYTGICHLKRQKPTDCPLKPLTDRLAEERKKVVQEIRDKALLKQMNIDNDYDYEVGANDDWVICMEDLDAILREVSDERSN